MAKMFDAEQVQDIFDKVPATDMLTRQEFNDIFPVFFDAVEDMRSGIKFNESGHFREFMDYMGLSDRNFPWEDFREWYDAG